MALLPLARFVPRCVVGLAAVSILTACGDGNGDPAADGRGTDDAMQAWLDELAGPGSRLTLSGAVTSMGEYTTAEDPRYGGVSVDSYRPGRGGGAARRGSNADGPYALTLYTDAIHEDSPEEVVRAWVTLVLPAGAEAGQRYTIAGFSDAEEREVQAHVRGHGNAWGFSRQVAGELYLAELGEQVSAAWRLEAAEGRGEEARRVVAEGAVAGLDFTPQREARYEITVNGDSEQYLGRVSIHETPNDFAVSIGNRIVLDVPTEIGAGEYALSDQAGDGAIRVSLMRHEVEEIGGAIRFSERNGVFDAEISLEASGEDEVQLSGRLEELDFDR